MNEYSTEFIILGLSAIAMTVLFLWGWFSDHKKNKHHHSH